MLIAFLEAGEVVVEGLPRTNSANQVSPSPSRAAHTLFLARPRLCRSSRIFLSSLAFITQRSLRGNAHACL